MSRKHTRRDSALRALVNAFPPLRLALRVNDLLCALFRKLVDVICQLLQYIFSQVYASVGWLCSRLFSLTGKLPFCWGREGADYQKLGEPKLHNEPIPYRNKLYKRFLTYHVGLLLGLALYLFVYYILIKHHTYLTISIALLLLLAYMIALENSHTLRSILMLSLPVMFTNRGRALIFCCMLGIMVSGPVKNTHSNIGELHASLHCCKQYLLVKTDKAIDENIVQNLAQVEKIVLKIVDDFKHFADQLRQQFEKIVDMAIEIEKFIIISIEKLKQIVNVCNVHTAEVHQNCVNVFRGAYQDCRTKLGAAEFLCEIVNPFEGLCSFVELPGALCKIPEAIMKFVDHTIGDRLRRYIQVIENELYFEVHINHTYSYKEVKSKQYKEMFREIGYDVREKFWYITFVAKIFNLVTLILVCWILITATLYHMHYLTELSYDNMYVDDDLLAIDLIRKHKKQTAQVDRRKLDLELDDADDESSANEVNLLSNNDEDEIDNSTTDLNNNQLARRDQFLFPLTRPHERHYMRPSSVRMNDFERSKLRIAGLVWIAIVGYICFFVFLDFALFKILRLVDEVLKDILFNSDLPLVDVSSKFDDGHTIRYNRTYLAYLRSQAKQKIRLRSQVAGNATASDSRLSDLYRRLMDSIEESVPDDVQILDSLEQCLPTAVRPNYGLYKRLVILALLTFGAVVLEAYILRTRHCIANLYYPRRAKKRAIWLYRKMLAEKPKFEELEDEPESQKAGLVDFAVKLVEARAKG